MENRFESMSQLSEIEAMPQPEIRNNLINVDFKAFSVVEMQKAVKKLKTAKKLSSVESLRVAKNDDGTILLWLQMPFNTIWDSVFLLTVTDCDFADDSTSCQLQVTDAHDSKKASG
ncbi:hypothetical protein QYM36_011090 [Artemia franciscana]|uniref:Uncharacterized protein n=1 Tax=Artemia franciscana TaxID=6661 RepID=A0AA88HNR3_ARTSF|nr:hypothetical protein QYM36_011090 [Artemia franciscana]